MIADAATLWWEMIAGPQLLIEKVTDALYKGSNILLQTPGSLPWQEQMRDFLTHRISCARIELVRLRASPATHIIPQILQQLYRSRVNRCPSDYKAQLAYLKGERIFQRSVIWIQLEPDCPAAPIAQLLSDFRSGGIEDDGALILELPDTVSIPRLSAAAEVISYMETVRFGDVRLFSSMLADSNPKIPNQEKSYDAQLAAQVAGRDGELVPVLLQYLGLDEEPEESLARLRQDMPEYAGRLPSGEKLEQQIWKAQLYTVFAEIEMARIQIAVEYADTIEEALATMYWNPRKDKAKDQTGYVKQFDAAITCAGDVELGTLTFMMTVRRASDHGQYLLYIPDEQERNKIFFLHKCRNSLAHHHRCRSDQMRELLAMFFAKA